MKYSGEIYNNEIFRMVCAHYTQKPGVIIESNKTRKREYVQTRQVTTYFFKEFTRLSYPQMGSFFGKDHATAMHACKTINNLKDTNFDFRHEIDNLESEIRTRLDVIFQSKNTIEKKQAEEVGIQQYFMNGYHVSVSITNNHWHMTISNEKKLPPLTIINEARFKYIPDGIKMAILFESKKDSQYRNTNQCHLWEIL